MRYNPTAQYTINTRPLHTHDRAVKYCIGQNNIYAMQPAQRKSWLICCVSDTHGRMEQMDIFDTQGDLFIHAGDFSQYSQQGQLDRFCELLDRLRYRHKVVVCGNHQIEFDPYLKEKKLREKMGGLPSVILGKMQRTPTQARQKLKKHCIYLEHEAVTIEEVTIFGSPYTLKHSETAFQYKPEEGQKLWKDIPVGVDILITHSPPYGRMDAVRRLLVFNQSIGCKHLAERIKTVKPRLHVFGHVHDGTGRMTSKDTQQISINAAQYVGKNKPLKNQPFFLKLEI